VSGATGQVRAPFPAVTASSGNAQMTNNGGGRWSGLAKNAG